jgi:uncharacterized protein (TIGR03000 family)
MRTLVPMSVLGLAALLVPVGRAAEPPSAATQPVQIQMQVPADAEVWFDGVKTQQTGSEREFISPRLRPGREYVYQVHVRFSNGGQAMDQNRRLTVRAGDSVRLQFGPSGERVSFYAGPSAESTPTLPTFTYPAWRDFEPSLSPAYERGGIPLMDYQPLDMQDYARWNYVPQG